MTPLHIKSLIEDASKEIGITWPLYGFVTSNPLSGFEQYPFKKALDKAAAIHGATLYPNASQLKKAYASGAIDRDLLQEFFVKNGIDFTPAESLEFLETLQEKNQLNLLEELDRHTVKWLSAFLDEGLAEWEMPGKEKGFFQAWRSLARYDKELKKFPTGTIPEDPLNAIQAVLSNYRPEEHPEILQQQLAALPGWVGYIKQRIQNHSTWQQKYPVQLEDYLAVRLWLAGVLKVSLSPERIRTEVDPTVTELQLLWLKAWEKTWQEGLLDALSTQKKKAKTNEQYPDAQLVFCIDTRSEPIRRHVEAAGNYETFGYAGFFGITMDYSDPETGLTRKSCPPIVPSSYRVSESPRENMEGDYVKFRQRVNRKKFVNYFLKRMKNMLPSTFGFVEGSGIAYGFGLIVRTIFPRFWYRRSQKRASHFEGICEPGIHHTSGGYDQAIADSIPLEEKVAIVKSAFDLLGWKDFAPLVVFTGHGSHTANNPFGSSLDCGACAASPGRHNARMLAKIANMKEVRSMLIEEHDIVIPDQTWFLGAEHNTTTDEIVLFDATVPDTHRRMLSDLKLNLKKAQYNATQERLNTDDNPVKAAERKAGNWAETRPEWGLAKNAGFIIAPRTSTKDLDLEGRCFLHSYNWKQDEEGKFLEGIMQGPMVVTQWINNHYYFATVDNQRFGSGSKITQNVTGMFGVVQGNGGDLKSGLPLQSLKENDNDLYHQPLRLSVIIEAPITWVEQILERNEPLKILLDNQWIYLIVNDPANEYKTFHYRGSMKWDSEFQEKAPKQIKEPVPA